MSRDDKREIEPIPTYEEVWDDKVIVPDWGFERHFDVQDFGYSYYIHEKNFFTPDECQQMMDAYDAHASAVQGFPNFTLLHDEEPWENAFDKCEDIFTRFNELVHYSLTGIVQPLRVTRYMPTSDQGWHADYTEYECNKLALITLLSPTSDFEGGGFEMVMCDDDPLLIEQGDTLVFSAFQGHRVLPITSGVRFTLLGWASGPRFV